MQAESAFPELGDVHTLEECGAACAKHKCSVGFQWNGLKDEKNEGDFCGCLEFKDHHTDDNKGFKEA